MGVEVSVGLKGLLEKREQPQPLGEAQCFVPASEDMSVKPKSGIAEILEQETGDLQALGKGRGEG